jgi:hypothetical protein
MMFSGPIERWNIPRLENMAKRKNADDMQSLYQLLWVVRFAALYLRCPYLTVMNFLDSGLSQATETL